MKAMRQIRGGAELMMNAKTQWIRTSHYISPQFWRERAQGTPRLVTTKEKNPKEDEKGPDSNPGWAIFGPHWSGGKGWARGCRGKKGGPKFHLCSQFSGGGGGTPYGARGKKPSLGGQGLWENGKFFFPPPQKKRGPLIFLGGG